MGTALYRKAALVFLPALFGTPLAAGVAAADPGASDSAGTECQTVDSTMLDVPRSDSQEPRLRIPVPPGWEQPPALDPADDTIRMALLNPGLAADGFTPNAVVALNRISAEGADAQQILDAQNEILVGKAGATDLSTQADQACGLPAMTSTYTAPATGAVPPRSAATRVVVYQSGDATYVATLTIQAVDPDSGSYAEDAQSIIDGFQVLSVR
jgi:hypothetical protein